MIRWLALPRTYAEYAPTGWAVLRARLWAGFGGPAARRRLRWARRPARTDDPLIGREARWLGAGPSPIPAGTMGKVTGWQPASGGRRYYFVEFGPDDGGWTVSTSLPAAGIELV